MKLSTELRVYGIIILVSLLLLLGSIKTGKRTASLETSVQLAHKEIDQLEDRNSELVAWIVTTREKMIEWSIKAGAPFTPPPIPESLKQVTEDDATDNNVKGQQKGSVQ